MEYKELMKYSEIMEWLGNNNITNIQFIYNMYEWQKYFKSVEWFKNFYYIKGETIMKYKLFCYNIKLFADMPAYVYNVMTMSYVDAYIQVEGLK